MNRMDRMGPGGKEKSHEAEEEERNENESITKVGGRYGLWSIRITEGKLALHVIDDDANGVKVATRIQIQPWISPVSKCDT